MTKLNSYQYQKCRKIFDEVDINNSGGIDIHELYRAVKKFSKTIEVEDIVDIFNEYDLDSNGEIDFNEFITVLERFSCNHRNEEDAIDVFLALGAKNSDDILDIQVIKDYLSIFEIEYDDILLRKHSINGKINVTNFKKLFFDMNLKID